MAGRWLVLSVRSPGAELQHELAAGLLDLGGTAVEERGDALCTWVAEPESVEALLERARAVLSARAGRPVEPTCAWEDDRDWLAEWRKGLDARRVGRRIVVTPTWIDPEAEPGDVVIAIDPQMAFGTGEHATTRIVLRAMEQLVRPGSRVLDVGAGSAILSIAAAALGACRVDAVESDADALENAGENVERNGASGVVRIVHAEADGAWLRANSPWDLIVANVLSGVLVPLLPAFRSALVPGGAVVLSGILAAEAENVRRAAAVAGLEAGAAEVEEEWWGGAFYRPRGG